MNHSGRSFGSSDRVNTPPFICYLTEVDG